MPAELLTGLAPIARRDARVLILGSMPGAASLAMQRYYAHPANAFWPLVAAVLGKPLPGRYAQRCTLLRQHGIALWDVVHRCVRPGSLDSAIDPRSVVANDIAGLLSTHRRIGHVFFNGGGAEQLFRRHLLPQLREQHPALCYARLPSSSPAHAALRFSEKLAAWHSIAHALSLP
jgi:TDG/mug DNA glycosylase family protein